MSETLHKLHPDFKRYANFIIGLGRPWLKGFQTKPDSFSLEYTQVGPAQGI